MLKQLADYAFKHEVEVEPGFVSDYIRWAVVLDSEKGFLGVQELGDTSLGRNNPGRFFRKCPELSQPEMVSGKERKSQFLVDDVQVITGKKVDRRDYFIWLLEEAGKTAPQLAIIARWLKDEKVLEAIKNEMKQKKILDTEDVTFVLDDIFPLDNDYWHEWWRRFRRALVKKIDKDFLCFVTGKPAKPMATHYKIKGLSGGRPSGDSLVSFDKDAFKSYGLEQSANASVSEEAMCAYRAGMNALLRDKNSCHRLAGTQIVHWFKKKVEIDPFSLPFDLPETEEVIERNAQKIARELLESLTSGKQTDRDALRGNFYYAFTLSGAEGRVMVRDWIEGQFEELVKNINQWFDDLETINLHSGKIAGSPSMERVITCLLPVRKPNQNYNDWVKPIGGERLALLHAAIKGTPFSYSIIPRLVLEHRGFILTGELDKLLGNKPKDSSTGLMYSLLYARMALIKAYHLRKYRKEGNTVMAESLKPVLNEDFQNPAYQCGRLMAVLAELQRRAMPNVESGIVQRYYAAASTTPSLVLGRLLKLSMFHVDKLKSKASAQWFENKKAEISKYIMEPLPTALTLEEQSLFGLGYYHQLADMSKDKSHDDEEEK